MCWSSFKQGEKMNTAVKSISMLAILFLSACSHVSPRYNMSATNVEELRQLTKDSTTKIASGAFTATETGKKSILCRAAGPIAPPDDKTFDGFIHDALFDELKLVNAYDQNSSVKLSANLDQIDFNSNIGSGKWVIRMTLKADGSEPFTVENTYSFSTNFIADIACEQVAQALPAATQDFIQKVFQAPEFKALLAKNDLKK
jgi:hypothetical protein